MFDSWITWIVLSILSNSCFVLYMFFVSRFRDYSNIKQLLIFLLSHLLFIIPIFCTSMFIYTIKDVQPDISFITVILCVSHVASLVVSNRLFEGAWFWQ